MTMSDVPNVGIDVSGRVIVLSELNDDLDAGGVTVPGLTMQSPSREPPVPPAPPLLPHGPFDPQPNGTRLFTCDAAGQPIDLPPGADPIVAAYTPSFLSGDPYLEAIKAVPLGSTTDELRDAIVAYLESR